MKRPIGIIGCGNMGSALIDGILTKHFRTASELLVWDSDVRKRKQAVRAFKVREARSNADLVSRVQTVLIAVKPQQMAEVLAEIKPHIHKSPILISIAAGIPISWIKRHVGTDVHVIRVMPNTPALIGQGVSAIAGGSEVWDMELHHAELLFKSVGEVVRVPERWMDAVTAVSGSGPAYFFYLMEQMIREGTALGLSRPVAKRLAVATAAGAAALAARGEEPAALRAKVTSQKGTTAAAFRVFERARLGRTMRAGIRAAARRSKELSR